VRNQEAARYARWAAIAASLIVLAVAGIYAQRAIREARAREASPPMVPATIQQRSADFSYSDVEQGRTVFTIRASRATQFKDQDRALLEDVWITVYGRQGNRNDNIHTRECSYEPLSGAIRCEGEVRIDIQSVDSASHRPENKNLQVTTRDLTFNRQTGEAASAEPVEFRFPEGQGRGVGISYSTQDSILRVAHAVEFDLNASDRSGGLPVSATGSSLEIRRDDRIVVLAGPVTVRQGLRELSADELSVQLDPNYHAQLVVAQGHAVIHETQGSAKSRVSAEKFEASLTPTGWIEHVLADGSIKATQQTAGGTVRFSAAHVGFTMLPERNSVREMMANGNVIAESQQDGDDRALKTDALRVTFSSAGPHSSRSNVSLPRHSYLFSTDGQRIESAETLAPATVESKAGNELTSLRAKRLVAEFTYDGHLKTLLGHSDVELRRQIARDSPEMSSATELTATFAANGEWETLDDTGNVHFMQNDRQASAARAKMNRSTGTITMEGSPVLSDYMSRTTAGSVVINQQSGELHASGGVVSTYLVDPKNDAINLGSGAAHISAESLSGSSNSGHIVYSGHVRLWQGESVLESDEMELWRDSKKMLASGHVVAVFPQSAGPSSDGTLGKISSAPPGPSLWQVRAPTLTYLSDQEKAHLEGGVVARSDQGILESATLDVFLAPSGPPVGEEHSPSLPQDSHRAQVIRPVFSRSQQLSRVLAEGQVIVRQGDRLGTGERAEYTAADGKFVLSGGQPTLTDASSDTTTGRSLTFFVANDTILIDSQQGSRTLTKHRVEK